MVESIYAKNIGEGLNPDERIQEEKDIALLETSADLLESDKFGQENTREFIAASGRLGLMEETDPSKISNSDERIHFQIDGKYYAYNQDTYSTEMSTEEAKSLTKLEEKFHTLEIKDRKLKGIDPNVDMTNAEKEHLEELKAEIAQIIEHEKKEGSFRAQEEEFDNFRALVNGLKEASEEKNERFRGKNLEGKINDIKNAEGNQEVFRLVSAEVNAEDIEQPKYENISKKLGEIQVDVPELEREEIENQAIDILIQKEVAERGGKDFPSVSFGEARGLLRSGNLTEQDFKYYLSNEDLADFYKERYINNPELFGINKDPERLKESDALMADYSNRARRNALENLKDVELEPSIPFGKVREFLLNDNLSISEISRFLEGKDFQDFGRAVYLEGNAAHFDIEGKPIDSEGKGVRDRFFEIAKERAEDNEYLAIEEKTESDFNESPMGKSVNTALSRYNQIISDNKPRHWRERFSFYVINANERERRSTKLADYKEALDAKRRIEKFKGSYLREQGNYEAMTRDFERSVMEKTGGAEALEKGNLSQRLRRQLRGRASKLRLEGLYMNAKIRTRLEGLADCAELEKAFEEKSFDVKNISDESGWSVPSVLGSTEQNERLGTTLEGEKKAFIESMGEGYGDIRKEIAGYVRNEFIRERGIAEGVNAEIKGGIISKQNRKAAIEQRLRIHTRELDKKIEEQVRILTNKFNTAHSDGLLDFAAKTGTMDKLVRRELRDEIFGDRGGSMLNATKVIDLLDTQRINELNKTESGDRFVLEMERFCGKERWRHRWERIDRTISGNPTFKKDEYKGLIDALEEGKSRRARTYQGGTKAKAYVMGWGAFSNPWNRSKGGAYRLFNLVAPYSEGTRQKIDDTYTNRQKRVANWQFRRDRISNFGRAAA